MGAYLSEPPCWSKEVTKLRTHYDNLKVSRDAPDNVIRAAYKTLSQKYHPDKNPGDERAAHVMAVINSSYEVLSDPERRARHDAWIAAEEQKLKRQTQPQSPPIPPAWQPPPTAQPREPEQNALLAILLWPLTIVLRIFIAVPQLLLLLIIVGGMLVWDAVAPDRPPPAGPKPYQAQAPERQVPAKQPKAESQAPKYVRPDNAPNGSPWPTNAAYIKGYPVDNADGYSKVTVDNSRNDADVFVKLVSLDDDTAYPVRQFYLPAKSRFTLDKVTAGKYDIRYKDLGTGGLSRSESFEVDETHSADSVQYSETTLSLYKVQGGNFHTYDLADSEF